MDSTHLDINPLAAMDDIRKLQGFPAYMSSVAKKVPWLNITHLLTELLNFFTLKVTAGPLELSPSPLIDLAWHELLLRPVLYRKVCNVILADHLVDHEPDGADDSDEVIRARYDTTLVLYKKAFAPLVPDEIIWPPMYMLAEPNVEANVEANAKANIGPNVEADAKADAEANVEANVEVSAKAKVGAKVGVTAKAKVGANVGATANNSFALPAVISVTGPGAKKMKTLKRSATNGVIVNSYTGGEYFVPLDVTTATIQTLLIAFYEIHNFSINESRLIFGGVEIYNIRNNMNNPGNRLDMYGIKNNSNLHIVQRLRGC